MQGWVALEQDQELSGDPNPQYFLKSTAIQMRGILPYKWEAYCSTNGKCTVGFPFLEGLEARKVQRYNYTAYCRTNWRCTAVLSSRPVGVVGVTLNFRGFMGSERSAFSQGYSLACCRRRQCR